MIRLRARVLALCVLGALPLSSPAATINVTTPFDIVANDDELCSIREAVTASVMAADLSRRKSADTSIEGAVTALEKALLDIAVDPVNVTYPRSDMVQQIAALVAEAAAYNIAQWDATIVADLAVFEPKMQAIGSPRGTFDFSGPAGNAYPTVDDGLAPGYYTYVDTAAPNADPVTITDTRNLPTSSLVYDVGDRAYWDGTNWRRFGPDDEIPTGVDTAGVQTAIALHERMAAATTSEIERLENLTEIDGCDDGTSFDVIVLDDLSECPGEPENGTICHFKLNSPLDMSVRLSLRGSGNSTVLERCDAGTCGGVASTGLHRLINVPESMTTEIMNMVLRGGDAGTGFGGAIHSKGQLKLSDMRIEDNRAAAGGAIHLDELASAEMENVHFTGNVATAGNGGAVNLIGTALKLTNVVMGEYVEGPGGAYTLSGNSASRHGGALAVLPALTGNVAITGGAYIGNQARRGSVIYVDSQVASIALENSTIAENHAVVAGAINFDLPLGGVGSLSLNNVTLVENTADAGSAGIVLNRLIPVQILNSVVAGNTDNGGGVRPDCDFVAGVIDPGSFRRNYYGNPAGGAADACPGARYPSDVPELENFELGAFQLIGDLLQPMNPARGPYYVPVFPDDVNNSTENRLVNRGAGSLEVSRCSNSDQRGHERSSSVDEECDIGAVEYQIGRRHDDVVELLVDERRCINVIDDDLGDALYIPGSLRVYDIERENLGYSAIVISRSPGAADNNPGVDPVLDLDVECPNEADIPHREAILVVPARGFRGQTNVLYGMGWQTGGANPVTGTVTAIARIDTESRGGITTSTLGALSPLVTFLFAGLLAMRRARVRWLAPLALAALSATAVAAEDNVIYVNSSLDEPVVTTPGDGRCTLREALDTARNDRANMSGGDCVDGNEGPDTIEFAVGLTEVVLENTVISYGNVTLRCPEPPIPAAGQPAPVPQVCTIRRRAMESDGVTPNPNQFRLIDSRGSLLVHRLVFQDGQAPDRGAGQDGGAIYSLGTLLIADSIFRNNSAVSGGAVFLAGPSSGLNVLRSVFEGNSSRAGTEIVGGAVVGLTPARAAACPLLARGGVDGLVGSRLAGGGAIATTQSDGHQIAIQSSSFLRNCSVAGAAATDLNTRSSAVVANTTFSGNVSFEGPGAIDVSGAQGSATLRNITVMENQSGIAVVRETWDPPAGVLQRRALQFGVVSVTMTSSIVSGNVTEADNAVAANCAPPGASVGSLYNVFGDEDDDPAGIPTVGGYTCRVQANSNDRLMYATELYDPAAPAAGLLSPLVGVEVGYSTIFMYVTRDVAAAAGVIVDAGFNDGGVNAEDNQVDPTFSSTGKCANVDARGASRQSGGRCDIGTFEVLGVTAKDDLESNRGRGDRLVTLDLVANDLFDSISALPEKALKDDCDTTQMLADTPVAGARTYRLVGPDTAADADANPDLCVEVVVPASEYAPPATPEDFPKGGGEVVFCHADTLVTAEPRCEGLIPESGFVLVYDNNDVIRDERHAGAIVLDYRVFTFDQDASNEAEIQMSVENVGPQAIRDEVIVGPGVTATINVLANDTDPDDSSPAGLKLTTVNGAGCTAVYSDEDDLETVLYWQCQFGRVTMDATGNVTWAPINSFNPFSEEISYEVSDQDPVAPKVAKSIVRFTVGRPVSNGGALLGKDDASDILGLDFLGAPSPLFFAVFLLAMGRRRVN